MKYLKLIFVFMLLLAACGESSATNRGYNPTGAPAFNSPGSSAIIRNEFAAIGAGFARIESEIDTKFSSGTYTPTITGAINVSSVTAGPAIWQKVGNVVTVSGKFLVASTNATVISVSFAKISIPVTSNFTSTGDCIGTGTGDLTTGLYGLPVEADTTRGTASIGWLPSDTQLHWLQYTFMYVVK